MSPGETEVDIASRDYWFKVVDFLQQNWALVDASDTGAVVRFFGDTSGVFDELSFPSIEDAVQALLRNGFRRFAEVPELHQVIALPQPPFVQMAHPNGPIYSSGRYWRCR